MNKKMRPLSVSAGVVLGLSGIGAVSTADADAHGY